MPPPPSLSSKKNQTNKQCFGKNNKGQLGLGDSDNRGDGESEMGDALPAVDLGANRTAVAVSAEGDRTCAILDNGKNYEIVKSENSCRRLII